jgi:eRF1 domain 1
MRLVKRNINRDGSGLVVLCPEEPEDMVCPYRAMVFKLTLTYM